MTDQELIAYFENRTQPGTVCLDRACTQHEVKDAVKRNIKSLLEDPKDGHAKYRLTRIMAAFEKPYNGPEIPRF